MNSNEQIKELRTHLKLSQEAFGKRIGVSRDVINNYERLRANVPPPTERAIAAEFGVNLTWLQTGQGEMFNKSALTFLDELAEKYNIDDFLKKVITAYMDLSENDRQTVRRYIENIAPPSSGGVRIYRAASSEEDHPDEITTMSDEDHRRLAEAPRTSSEESDL